MANIRIVDDAIWIKHIEGSPGLQERIRGLSPGDVLDLEVGGIVGRWERMRDGRDGRPTFGIKPIAAMREVWARMRRETGKIVAIREITSADSYLEALAPAMNEWNSLEDEIAYRDL